MSKLLVFAGPNGSGKSTITSRIPICGEYVNADSIQRYLGCSPLEAAQVAEATRESYLSQDKDFTFETVLSTSRNIELMRRAKAKRYHVVCIYVLTYDPKINICRVEKRVSQGGHDVPREKIYQRYVRALAMLPDVFAVCDELYVFDNSLDAEHGQPGMVIRYVNGSLEVYPGDVWTQDMIESLILGKYPEKYILGKA